MSGTWERIESPYDQRPFWTEQEAAELSRILRWGTWEDRARALRAMDAADRKIREQQR